VAAGACTCAAAGTIDTTTVAVAATNAPGHSLFIAIIFILI
jgi:hypothetical protein